MEIYVSNRIVVKDAGTARTRPSLLNNVDVLYRTYLGGGAAHNATFADDADAQLRVAGGVGIVQTYMLEMTSMLVRLALTIHRILYLENLVIQL